MSDAFRVGDELTADGLNALAEGHDRGRIAVDGSSGLTGISTPSGRAFGATRRPEGWYRVTSTTSRSPGPAYARLLQQLPRTGGTWVDGTWQVGAYNVAGDVLPPVGAIVRAWYDLGAWLYEYSRGCP